MRPAPLLAKVVVAGVGLIGGSLALGARQRFLAERVIGLDRDPTVLDAARGLGVIDEAHLAPGPWLEDADLVVLATPARSLVPLGREIFPYLPDHAVVTDVGSVKEPVVRGLRDLARGRFVGGHPMAGSERAGVLHADAALLENAVWVLTPDRPGDHAGNVTNADGKTDADTDAAAASGAGIDPGATPGTSARALERVRAFVEALGARTIETSPEQHDRLVAVVSHVPYLAAVALTALVDRGDERGLKMLLAAGGLRDLTRVASGDPRMSRDMVSGNRAAVTAALRAFREELEALERLLDDPEALEERAADAKRVRDSIPIVRRNLLPARHEVVIAVPDRPGEFARITQALGAEGVNIKDLEVLGVRESGGAIRLAFEDEDALERGKRVLAAAGYEVRGRNGAHGSSAG